MKFRTRVAAVVVVCLAAGVSGAAAHSGGGVRMVTLPPVADVSLPFWCDWAYDWEARCYRDDSDRLPVGGDTDKVWRPALRFSLTAVPSGAEVVSATLRLHHDATCLGPRKTTRPCSQAGYTFALHPIFTAAWFSEREVEIGDLVSTAELDIAVEPQWVAWDVTELVARWLTGEPNHGVLLKLVDEQEDFGVGGPAFASSSSTNPALRPVLEVAFVAPDG